MKTAQYFAICDRCNTKQEVTRVRPTLECIKEVKIHLKDLSTHREGPPFPYDWKRRYDLCPRCRKALKHKIEVFMLTTPEMF